MVAAPSMALWLISTLVRLSPTGPKLGVLRELRSSS